MYKKLHILCFSFKAKICFETGIFVDQKTGQDTKNMTCIILRDNNYLSAQTSKFAASFQEIKPRSENPSGPIYDICCNW